VGTSVFFEQNCTLYKDLKGDNPKLYFLGVQIPAIPPTLSLNNTFQLREEEKHAFFQKTHCFSSFKHHL
jgi:hypothetical protein